MVVMWVFEKTWGLVKQCNIFNHTFSDLDWHLNIVHLLLISVFGIVLTYLLL